MSTSPCRAAAWSASDPQRFDVFNASICAERATPRHHAGAEPGAKPAQLLRRGTATRVQERDSDQHPNAAARGIRLEARAGPRGTVIVGVALAGRFSTGAWSHLHRRCSKMVLAHWRTTATTITQWWGTTAYPNGTHTITVRVTDTAGKSARSTVNVLVRN
jgi:hypothetical protein